VGSAADSVVFFLVHPVQFFELGVKVSLQLGRIETPIDRVELLSGALRNRLRDHKPPVRRLGGIVVAVDPPFLPMLTDELHHRLKEVLVLPKELIELSQENDLLIGVIPQVPHHGPDVGGVLLFHETVVILLVGTRPSEGDPVLLTIAEQVPVDEGRSIIRVQCLPGEGTAGAHAIDCLAAGPLS